MTREKLVSEAERLAEVVRDGSRDWQTLVLLALRAQVYATLALVEATRPSTLEEKA